MGFEDQVADSGAELTSLKKKELPLLTGSEVSPWEPLGLLGEKKKEDRLGFEPGQYAVQGTDSQGGASESRVEVQTAKRFSGGSMARNVAYEPVGEKLPMFALKPTKSEPVLQKNSMEGYPQVASYGSGEHMFANKKLVSEPAYDKKIGLEPATYDKKLGLSQSLDEAQTMAVLTKTESKLGLTGTERQLVPTYPVVEGFSTPMKGSSFVGENNGGNSFVQKGAGPIEHVGYPVVEKLQIGSIEKGSSVNAISSMVGSPVVEKSSGGGTDRLFATTTTGPAALGSALQQGEPASMHKFGAPVVQQQIASYGLQDFGPVKEKVGGTVPLSKHDQVAPPVLTQAQQFQQVQTQPIQAQTFQAQPIQAQTFQTQPIQAQTSALKFEQALSRGEQGANRILALEDQLKPRRQEFSAATAGNGIIGNANPLRQAEITAPATRKLMQGADSGVQSGIVHSALAQPGLAQPGLSQLNQSRKLIAEGATLSELPSKFSKTTPQLTQIERLTADTQLRAQTDRIASGAQLKAQADQTTVKLKGEVATTNVRLADQPAAVRAGQQQFESSLQPRIAPLTGKTTQDLVSALKPQDRVAGARDQSAEFVPYSDRRTSASVIRTGADALVTPYVIDRGTRMGNAHVISGDVKVLSEKIAPASQIAALLNNVKDGKGDISRSLSFDPLMTNPVKNTQDRYVGGEFLLASLIIAAGAARRMPEQRAEGQVAVPPTRGEKNVIAAQPIRENSVDSGKSSKTSPFAQIVDTIAKGFTTSRAVEQTQAIEASRRATANQGQSDSVRYITGVELAILLAAGGVTKLRSDKTEASKSAVQGQDDTVASATKVTGATKIPTATINFASGRQPLNAGADMHVTTQIVASMSGPRNEFLPPLVAPPKAIDVSAPVAKGNKQIGQPADLVVRSERCIPGADVAIAAMLMLGGVTRKRTEGRFPAGPNDLAEKVDRPFRLDRRLGEIVAQAKSFVAREPLPVSGLRATAANLVSAGDVVVPPQYKQGALEPKVEVSPNAQQFEANKFHDKNEGSKKPKLEIVEAIVAPTGWVHEPLLSKELIDEVSEEKLKKVEQDQQEGAGAGAAATLYRPIWIIAPGETFVSIAESHFGDGAIAWLIADLNIGKFSDSIIEGKRVIEIQCRQRIELPVASDIEEFRHNRKRHQDAENIITIVTASQLDIELKQATFKQFLGTLQNNMPVPGMAVLPQLDLVVQKPARAAAPFGMTAPQFASIAAAVSLPLIVPQLDMVQQPTENSNAHVQDVRTEIAKPEESV